MAQPMTPTRTVHAASPAPPTLPPSISAVFEKTVYGNVAVGTNIVQLNVEYGGRLDYHEASQPPSPRPAPVHLLPPIDHAIIGRLKEARDTREAIAAGKHVEVDGAPGIGKTTLLALIAHEPATDRFTDGIIYLDADRRDPDDILQSIFSAFYHYASPTRPTQGELRTYLQETRALILLDDGDMPLATAGKLRNALPKAAFIFCSEELRQRGVVAGVRLKSLPKEDAIALLEMKIERKLSAEELPHAERLWETSGGVPLRILEAGAVMCEDSLSLQEVAGALPTPQERLSQRLNDKERLLLGALACFGGQRAEAAVLDGALGIPDAHSLLDRLSKRHLIKKEGFTYRLDETGESRSSVGPLTESEATTLRRQLAAFVIRWMEEPKTSRAQVAAQEAALLALADDLFDHEEWHDALDLARGIEGALALSGRWGAWERALRIALEAAVRRGDRKSEAWAQHQLGTRAVCLMEKGDPSEEEQREEAKKRLLLALEMRTALLDTVGAAITQHNLNMLAWLSGSGGGGNDDGKEERKDDDGGGNGRPNPFSRFALVAGIVILLAAVMALGGAAYNYWAHPAPIRGPKSDVKNNPVNVGKVPEPEVPEPKFPELKAPEAVDFESATVGGTGTEKTVKVENSGTAPLTIGTITLKGENGESSRDFERIDAGAAIAPIEPGKSGGVRVRFTPTSAGDRQARLVLQDDTKAREHTIRLTGTGTLAPVPAISVSPVELRFPEQAVGTTGSSQSFTVTNTGNTPVTIRVFVSSGEVRDFQLTPDLSRGALLQPKDPCEISVAFTPAAGGARSARVTIEGDQINSRGVELSGTGSVPAAHLSASPPQLDFADPSSAQGRGKPAERSSLLDVTNDGDGTAHLSAPYFEGQNSGDFFIPNPIGSDLAHGGRVRYGIFFRGQKEGRYATTLVVPYNGANAPLRVAVTANVPRRPSGGRLSANPPSLSFGRVIVGQSAKPQPLTLTNTGDADVAVGPSKVTGDWKDFPRYDKLSKLEKKLIVVPRDKVNLEFGFRPGAQGQRRAVVNVWTSGGTVSVELDGEGIEEPKGKGAPAVIELKSVLYRRRDEPMVWRIDYHVTNAVSASIDQGFGDLQTRGQNEYQGYRIVSPKTKTVYTLTATGTDGVPRQDTVTLDPDRRENKK